MAEYAILQWFENGRNAWARCGACKQWILPFQRYGSSLDGYRIHETCYKTAGNAT